MLLFTDDNVMSQEADTPNRWKHIPDQYGDYVNGTWVRLAKGPNVSFHYASAVLRGRVFVAGSQYNAGAHVDLLTAEIYGPIANAWTTLGTPTWWTQGISKETDVI